MTFFAIKNPGLYRDIIKYRTGGCCQIWDFYSRGSGRTTYRNFSKQRRKLLSTLLLCQIAKKKNFCKKKDYHTAAFFYAVVLIPSRYRPRLTLQFIPLPTFHLEGRTCFFIKLSSFLKQIFYIYHFLEEGYFYKKKIRIRYLS